MRIGLAKIKSVCERDWKFVGILIDENSMWDLFVVFTNKTLRRGIAFGTSRIHLGSAAFRFPFDEDEKTFLMIQQKL